MYSIDNNEIFIKTSNYKIKENPLSMLKPSSSSEKKMKAQYGNDNKSSFLNLKNMKADLSNEQVKRSVFKNQSPPIISKPITVSSDVEKIINPSKPLATTKSLFKRDKISPYPSPVKKNWKIDSGVTLREGILQWANSESCSGGHWTLLWETPVNYRVDAALHFSGDFKNALNGVFELYRNAQKPLYAITNTPQCLLRVTSK